jgi:hypothetical protein
MFDSTQTIDCTCEHCGQTLDAVKAKRGVR